MFTLGLSGGLDLVHSKFLDSPENYTYDGAAVLLEDGRVVAALGQERVDRIARSNKFPSQAIARCLAVRGIALSDVDHVAYYIDERIADRLLARIAAVRPGAGVLPSARELFARMLTATVGPIDPARLRFVDHRLTHAHCALAQAGTGNSLIYVIDNIGGIFTGRLGERAELDLVASFPPDKALGRLCQAVFPALRLGLFDEHRALALAATGDAARARATLAELYTLLPDGDYVLHLDRVPGALGSYRGEPADLAAALQDAQEAIVLHVLAHHRRVTGHRRLAIAGGMAENPATNGRIARDAGFDAVHVSPVAGDAGCALGAALATWYEAGGKPHGDAPARVDWGPALGTEAEIAGELARWHGLLAYDRVPDPARRAAELLAAGEVIGWVAGRGDLGCHALGTRNAWVDPRLPATRATRALRRADTGRPHAAVVLAEHAGELFEIPAGASLAFQAVMASARAPARTTLPGVCAADGSVRPQSISADGSATRRLVECFHAITGVPVLATTSLNTGSEPVVESLHDAITALLTSDIDHLVAESFVVHRLGPAVRTETAGDLALSLPAYVTVVSTRGLVERQNRTAVHELHTTYDHGPRRRLSPELGDLLARAHGPVAVAELLGRGERDAALITELEALWRDRLIALRPIIRGATV